jgi:hypothetical protein
VIEVSLIRRAAKLSDQPLSFPPSITLIPLRDT